jgi:L-amino acid N-acyltransferase YncA
MTNIRTATPDDAAALLAIYAPYVKNTGITFELEVPTVGDFRQRIVNTLKMFPYLVAVDEAGKAIGYCYAGKLRPRPAYNHCVEVSIYIDKDAHHRGIGTALYTELERRLKAMNIINLYASVTWTDVPNSHLTRQSKMFHERMGYNKVGHFHHCGNKFGEWFDMIWMEKFI